MIVGNGSSLPIPHTGYSSFTTFDPRKSLVLKDVLHVPSLTKNLLSISQFTTDNNVILEFDSTCCLIKDKSSKQVLLTGTLHEGLYQLQTSNFNKGSTVSVNPLAFNCTTDTNPVPHGSNAASIWHQRLGHPTQPILAKTLSCISPSLTCKSSNFCDACQLGKMHQFSFKPSNNNTTAPFELVHSDVWGPSFYPSMDGYKYYLSFVDDFTHFVCLFPMQVKSEVYILFKQFHNYVERQFSKKIRSVQMDLGTEYKPLYAYFREMGIERRNSCPHTHQQMGRVERKHRHVVDTGLTLLAQAKLPLSFWWEAFTSAAYLINRLPTPTLQFSSPFEQLFHASPDYNLLKVFGSACFPLLRPYNDHKVSFRSS